MRCVSLSNNVYNKIKTIKLLILNFKFMKNDFFKISSKRILFSMMMASALLAGIRSAITPDDTIDSMRRIGNDLPVDRKSVV